MQIQIATTFLGELIYVLWKPSELANRALDLTKTVNCIPNRSPVKLIQHNLLRLLISNYEFFNCYTNIMIIVKVFDNFTLF